MRQIKIDLSEPFEKVLKLVLAAPASDKAKGCGSAEAKLTSDSTKYSDFDLTDTADVKKVLRYLYEAAHGRQVETPIGLIPIAPPVADFLKAESFYIGTQLDFLLAALTRLIEMPLRVKEGQFGQTQVETHRTPSILIQGRAHKSDHELVPTSTYD